jgi:transcription elongation factor GreA
MSPNTTLLTPKGLEELRAEIAELETTERTKIAARIKTAREWGDLKENAEYHAAKEEQGHLETRILKLRDMLRSAEVVEEGAGDSELARFGATVSFDDVANGGSQSFRLVSSKDAKPTDGLLSIESPVARALTGHRVGDIVEVPAPRGSRRLRITAIR